MIGIGWAELLLVFMFFVASPIVAAVSIFMIIKSLARRRSDSTNPPA